MKPACWFRTKDGKLDWAEDCVATSKLDLTDGPDERDGYGAIPLYAIPEGWTLVPNEPTDGMLRAFYECPPDELRLAWAAMLKVTQATVPVVDMPPPLQTGVSAAEEWSQSLNQDSSEKP